MIPYIQLSYNETLEAKKQVLSSQINLLTIIKKIDSFKSRRKQELDKKYLLKQELRSNIAKLSSLLASLPEVDAGSIKLKHTSLKSEPIVRTSLSKKSQNVESELNEIRDKLASL